MAESGPSDVREVGLPWLQTLPGPAPRLLLDARPISQRSMLALLLEGKRYKATSTDLILTLLRPGDGMIDVGAHVGLTTVLGAARVGPEGRVIAIEPDETNLSALRRNVALNGFEDRVTVVAGVAADMDGTRTLYANLDKDGGHALWEPARHDFNRRTAAHPVSRDVVAVTLDTVVDRLGPMPVKLIKIDTEGAEALVLAGAVRLLDRLKVPYVLAEVNDFGLEALGSSQAGLRGMMESRGYATFLPRGTAMPAFVPPGAHISWQDYVGNVLFARPEDLCRVWPIVVASADGEDRVLSEPNDEGTYND